MSLHNIMPLHNIMSLHKRCPYFKPNARTPPECPNPPVLSFPFARMSESASSLLPFCPNARMPPAPHKKMMSGVHIPI